MNKHLFWAALLGLSSAYVVAQEGPAPASLPQPAEVIVDEATQAPAQTELEIVKSAERGIDNAHLYVTEQADKFVRERKAAYRRQGRSQEVFLQYGVADVSRQPTSPDWADARSIAYLQAQTKAREALIKELYISISSDVAREAFTTNQGPEFTPEELQRSGKLDAMFDKLVAVADASLDQKLVELGVDPEEFNAAPPSKRKLMMRKAISRTVGTRSRGEIGGAMIIRTFEITDTNGNTSVAAVLSTSNKMKNVLASLRQSKGHVEPEPEKRGINLDSFLESNKANLMYEYGVKMMRDEQGYPMLVSFGMAGNDCNPVDYEECNDNRDFAFIEAEQEAYAHISEAYNLYGSMETQNTKGQERERNATLTKTDAGEETLEETTTTLLKETRQMSRMSSSVKGLVGLQVAKRWTHKHPISNREINGVVVAWHPQKEQAMRTFKAGKVPGQQGQNGYQSGSNQGASMDMMDISDF
ncbi:DUF6844 domain-containing protein [uncultured Oceanisphaera sp.]|uniref:DUF6844 domain-containing protein n=1 Tax=uncultured Oceanisphaera sp. TaxID=353858 RepID=UPI0026330B09|nr:hypothetical protein [uncultured Oceanisphaera sp.]